MEDNDGILKIWASLPKDIQEALKKSAEESSAVTEE
jgi:TRAP-type C4-dicarboxylate transport system substrate-binding protein